VKFWDTSALVQLFINQISTAKVYEWSKADPFMTVWWGTHVECASAIGRLSREGRLESGELSKAWKRLEWIRSEWDEIDPSTRVRETAIRFLRVHSLRAGDAFQLAAAFVASENNPSTLEFVCLDQRLADAASKEGFRVLS
jgi:uncharacterized protein